jgi:hypothetical protein
VSFLLFSWCFLICVYIPRCVNSIQALLLKSCVSWTTSFSSLCLVGIIYEVGDLDRSWEECFSTMLAIGAASSSECLENCLYFAHCTVLVLFLFPGVPPPPCMSSQGQPGFSDQHFCSLLYYDRWGHFVGRKRADNKLCSNGKGSYCAKDITSVPVSVVFSGLLLAAAAWHFLIQLCLRGFKDPGT